MSGLIKGLTTVVGLVASAKIGQELYQDYKHKQNEKQLKELQEFVESIDIEKARVATETRDPALLAELTSELIDAAEKIRTKSRIIDFQDGVKNVTDELKTTVTDLTKTFDQGTSELFDQLGKAFDETIASLDQSITEAESASEDKLDVLFESDLTFVDFVTRKAPLIFSTPTEKIKIYIDNPEVQNIDYDKKIVTVDLENTELQIKLL